jgi:hypothetical protein
MARDRLDLDQALAPDATVGQVVAVRYTGGSQVFLDGDTSVWKVPVGMFATFLAAFVVGISMAWYCFGPVPLLIVRRRYRATAAG